jgi:DNA-binding CsgD family transcriptional regulator
VNGCARHLAAIVEAMSSGAAGGVVVAGPAGAGRTRLAEDAIKWAGAEGFATQLFTAETALSSVPFGAFARLLAGVDRAGQDRLQWFLAILQTLRDAAGGRPLVIVVDDAHLLDWSGAVLIYGLASTKAAFVLATVRTGARCPEPILSLWKDGVARRLELPPLSFACEVPWLTPREREVASLAACGLSNRQVARRLFISLRTVENHLHRAFSKLQVTGRQDLHHALERQVPAPTGSSCP